MKPGEDALAKFTFWQLIFFRSKVNGAPYRGERLEGRSWDWPAETYLQRRLREIRTDRPNNKDYTN